MGCQKCQSEMTRVEKLGVTIETCPTCGGVWLEKGELAKLVAKATQTGPSVDDQLRGVRPSGTAYGRPYRDRRIRHDQSDDHQEHKSKRRSIWDIFD